MEEVQPQIVVSVLVVSFNCAAALRQCVQALERSSARDTMEILVVDNGSRDESGRIDQEFSDVTVLRLPRNFGLTQARNIGARTAKGQFLFFLDPDIEVAPDTVAALTARLEADPAAAVVCPLLVDRAGRPVSRVGQLPSPADLYRAWARGDWWSRPLPNTETVSPSALEAGEIATGCADPRAMLLRSQFLRGMNYFDAKYGQFGSNLQLFAQIRTAGKRILLLPGVKVVSHEGEGLWKPEDTTARADLCADYAAGMIRYAKYFGWSAWVGLRLKALAGAFLRAVTFRDPGLHFGVFARLLSGAKIDGSQVGF